MTNDNHKIGDELKGLTPDPKIAALLGSLPQGEDVVPWQNVLAIVDNAPAVKVPWYSRIWYTNQRQLRLAAMPVCLLLMVCTMWVMPAQSDHAGTVVVTNLPVAWEVGSPAFGEVEQAARSGFAVLDNAQANLFIKVGTEGESKKLVFALLGVGHDETVEYFAKLRDTFPALAATNENYIDVSNGHYDNRLEEVFDNLARKVSSGKLVQNDQIKLNVLKFMRESGFEDIQVGVSKEANGDIVIEIDAAMKVIVPASAHEQLNNIGLTEELLGKDGFASLLSEMNASQ